MTVVQKQCLLAFLGYYPYGEIDGQWGPKSEAAARRFQSAYGLKTDSIVGQETEEKLRSVVGNGSGIAEEPNWWEEIRWFAPEEFDCKCGGRYCNGRPASMRREAVLLADRAREYFGRPGHVVSGLRCERHNAACGGVANSQHMFGEAVDLRIEGVSAKDLLAFLQPQPEVRYAYAINSTNVHFDIPKGAR